ncbi:MAG: DUF2130 domain-containing protein [Helicobacteraceae bacterium]|nr:DUF2130 domain-containing protein [Helicobacteraceae bacterium]
MESNIKCPECGVVINVKEVVQEELKKELEAEAARQRAEYKAALESLEKQKASLINREKNINEQVKKELQESLLKEREILKKEILKDNENSLESLKKELNEKSKQIKELNYTKIKLEQAQREKQELESKLKAEAKKELNAELLRQREQLQKELNAQNELKLKEKDLQLESMTTQIKELQRKAEQGSQQLQGEVQELAIEEYLKARFPFDNILEIKKGAKGGDCLQIVNTREVANCGKIYYESKRAKEFSKAWIEKFKDDIREKGADIGVLVSEVMPKELECMGVLNGVFICTFLEFKALVGILRENVISLHLAKSAQINRQDKMQLLYNYLTSVEFKMQIEAIVEGFSQMQSDLDAEKRAMQNIWKKREKQIQRVLENTIDMHASLKGIAGAAVGEIKALELKAIALES